MNQLQRARALELPQREAMLRRDPSVQRFWDDNRELLTKAWSDWENEYADELQNPTTELLDASLRAAVTNAWNDPSTESAVSDLLEEVTPGVFCFQFFDPERIAELRDYLELVWDAEIPLRPPYGIVLNRRGAMLDPRSVGHLGAPGFQAFYRDVIDTYMRPIARLVLPEVVGFDTQTFGFSINYQPSTDTSIRPHSDASAVTLNINLNTPDEDYTGSSVDFLNLATGEAASLLFEPGMAMLHRGSIPHAAQPITSGQRTNFVLWLLGERGQLPQPLSEAQAIDARERWSVPTTAQDDFAPF